MVSNIRVRCVSISVALIAMGGWLGAQAQSSVLTSGKWYKMSVEKDGVYKIDRSLFQKMGFSTSNSDPRRIKIYTQDSGMLPQPNNEPRINDLVEISLFVQGESDGVFNQQDYILFYAQGPDKVSYDQSRNIFDYSKHLYAKSNFYFITVGDSPGKRISTSADQGTGFPTIREFENLVYHEVNQHNELKSGREWFGERFDVTTELTLKFELNNVMPNTPIKFISDVMSQAFGNSSFTIFLNGIQIGQQDISPIPNTQYGIKGRHARDTLLTNSSTVAAPGKATQEIRYQYIKSSSGRSVGYLDFCLLQATQQLMLNGNQTVFRSTSSLQNPVSSFEINPGNSSAIVWDITNSVEPILQQSSFTSGKNSFSTATTLLKEFIVFLPNAKPPKLIGPVAHQNLRGRASPTLLIIVHPDFKSEALRLKSHRESFSNIQALVATTEEVYNEFSGGKQDVTAFRDLAKYYFDKNPGSLKAILLFGKCSYDYNDVLVDNKNFVPTYQSRNSLHPLQTYSSDDYFGFLEATEGEWGESPSQAHSLDIGVGRLPIKSINEAKNVVDKIIRYDTDKKLYGRWRKNIYFVADDGDFNIHNNQADQMARNIDLNFPLYDTRKIYIDAYPQIPGAGGETSPETKKQIEKAFNEGALVINYTGHGAERLWAQERILDDVMIQKLNHERLPLLVTATCEFGRQDDPLFPSGGELSILQPKGGAIGLVTTARPVSSSTNFDLNQAFYDAFFQKENGKSLTLGEIFRRTKNNSISGVSNRNFSLIGDPSMHLAMPEYSIQVNSVLTGAGTDELKALSSVVIQGEIIDDLGIKVESFNGTLEATLFDKKTSFLTQGNENSPFPYQQWFNTLFRGKASIENGSFELNFIVPKNIAYATDFGKLSLYAYQTGEYPDASGFSQDFTIGSSEDNVDVDTTPPTVSLYMDDLTFKNGGVTGPSTRLIARLSDASGINISGYGIGNSIIAVLDENESFILNDYYDADTDDYKQGTIDFKLNDLKPGKHTIALSAWDTYNNPTQTKIDFTVSDGSGLVIEEFANYPNPFNQSTQLYFTHNQAGATLEASLILYDHTGRIVSTFDFSIPESTYQVNLIKLTRDDDLVKNLKAGLYLARLMVRSLADSSKNERLTKLIITN